MPDTALVADHLGRPVVAEEMKQQIATALSAIPDGKRGAVLVIADQQGTRAHFAARVNEHWKVAAGAGWAWSEKRPSGWVGVEASW